MARTKSSLFVKIEVTIFFVDKLLGRIAGVLTQQIRFSERVVERNLRNCFNALRLEWLEACFEGSFSSLRK